MSFQLIKSPSTLSNASADSGGFDLLVDAHNEVSEFVYASLFPPLTDSDFSLAHRKGERTTCLRTDARTPEQQEGKANRPSPPP